MSNRYNRPRHDNDGNVELVGPDPRSEYWEGAPFGVSFDILRFAEIIDPDTKDGEEKEALERTTGGDDFRLARADPETERRFKEGVERASGALTISKSSKERYISLEELREEYRELVARFPEEKYSIEQELIGLDDIESISEENEVKNYDDLITILNADFYVKLQASADEANRNFRTYERRTTEFSFKTTEEKLKEFFKDEL